MYMYTRTRKFRNNCSTERGGLVILLTHRDSSSCTGRTHPRGTWIRPRDPPAGNPRWPEPWFLVPERFWWKWSRLEWNLPRDDSGEWLYISDFWFKDGGWNCLSHLIFQWLGETSLWYPQILSSCAFLFLVDVHFLRKCRTAFILTDLARRIYERMVRCWW